MSTESRLADVEESLRLLRDADRLQGRRFSAAAPNNGDVAAWNATTKKWEPVSGVTVIDRDLDQVDVVSSTDEETLYSHSIPADTLGATGGFRLTLSGDLLENAAGTLTLKTKLGATTVFSNATIAHNNSASRYNWQHIITCMNSSATAQKWTRAFTDIVGIVALDATLGLFGVGKQTSSVDTTAAVTLAVTAQWTASSASLSIRKELAILELLATT